MLSPPIDARDILDFLDDRYRTLFLPAGYSVSR